MSKNSGKRLNKSRYGRVSTKKSYEEEFANALKKSCDEITQALGASPKRNNSSSSTNNNKPNKHNIKSKVKGYSLGDLVWAKSGKFPIWPGIIINEPESQIYSKSKFGFMIIFI